MVRLKVVLHSKKKINKNCNKMENNKTPKNSKINKNYKKSLENIIET